MGLYVSLEAGAYGFMIITGVFTLGALALALYSAKHSSPHDKELQNHRRETGGTSRPSVPRSE